MRPFEYTEVASFIQWFLYTEVASFFNYIPTQDLFKFLFLLWCMVQVVLKDEPDIDPNDHSSILEHLDKVVCIVLLLSSFLFVQDMINLLYACYLLFF